LTGYECQTDPRVAAGRLDQHGLAGLIFPARSASSIMLTPMRSFTLAQGLKLSSLAATLAWQPAVTLLR